LFAVIYEEGVSMADNQVEEVQDQLKMYQNNLVLQVALQEIKRALGPLMGHNCLNIGDIGGVFGSALRKHGGTWSSIASNDKEAKLASDFIGEEVYVLDDNEIPFADKAFDLVILINSLEEVDADGDLIAECHRVLKSNGYLVVVTGHLKKYTVIYQLQRILGSSYENAGMVRGGYSEKDIFVLLKDGFDMSNFKTYSRFFVNIVDAFTRSSIGRIDDSYSLKNAVERYRKASLWYRIAYQLDLLQFMFKGFSMICTAKKREWVPRNKPILTYNRSLGESVISRLVK
jgi:2-polyprenyl-3-methyl-5-hydroxy-6-metoxy-1,4-benzoquinol methylase